LCTQHAAPGLELSHWDTLWGWGWMGDWARIHASGLLRRTQPGLESKRKEKENRKRLWLTVSPCLSSIQMGL